MAFGFRAKRALGTFFFRSGGRPTQESGFDEIREIMKVQEGVGLAVASRVEGEPPVRLHFTGWILSDLTSIFCLRLVLGFWPLGFCLLGRAVAIQDSLNRESIQNPNFQVNRESTIRQNERISKENFYKNRFMNQESTNTFRFAQLSPQSYFNLDFNVSMSSLTCL